MDTPRNQHQPTQEARFPHKSFDEWVFRDSLEKELRVYLKRPEVLPAVTVFHGYPGLGKTSFAKFLAITHTPGRWRYFPLNEGFNAKIFDEIKGATRMALWDHEQNGPIRRIIILDEFHNVHKEGQEKFKTFFDEMTNEYYNSDLRIFVILNTTKTKPLHRVVSPAIFSRLHSVDFNLPMEEVSQVVEKAAKKYTYLSKERIYAVLPDFRRIKRENDHKRVLSELIDELDNDVA